VQTKKTVQHQSWPATWGKHFLSNTHHEVLNLRTAQKLFGTREDWMILEDQAVLRSYDSAPCPPPPCLSRQQLSLFLSLCESPVLLHWRERGEGGGGWAWSRITGPHESLVLYESFNPLWLEHTWLRLGCPSAQAEETSSVPLLSAPVPATNYR
jgi:hypothetical protein